MLSSGKMKIGVIALCIAGAGYLTAFASEPTPTQCLQSFMTAISAARELKDIEQYMCKEMRDEYRRMTPQQRTAKLNELKAYWLHNPKYGEEKISGNTAAVAVRGTGYQKGIKKNTSQNEAFTFIRENNYWRITGASLKATFRI